MDLIERKIALEILKELHGEQVMSKYFTQEQCQRTRNGILMAYNEIHSMPTVDAEPVRHGKIIETIKDGKYHREFSCCGRDFTQLTMWYMPRFCPNCGARMDGD